jgi:cellobiose transport system permease protein
MRLRRLDVAISPYLYISPFFIVFLGFGLFPLAYTFYVSLNHWELGASTHQWVGFHNYTRLLADPYFWNALRNTGSIWVLSTVPQLFAALVLAHVLNRRLRFRTLFRVGVLMPNVASVVAVSIVFAQLFGRDFGLVNWLLHFVGIGPIDWQVGRWGSHPAISSMIIWRWTGWNALLYLAALQAVPRELYEAAAIDGASGGQQFRKITIPMLRPTIIFTVIVSTIYGMQIFAEPLLFDTNPGSTTGGASREFQTVTMFLYEQGWRNLQFGYAAAVAWMLFIVIVIFVLLNYSLTRRIRSTGR